MRLEQLYLFQKIAETGSIRKASEALFTSPQNTSKAMIQLEKEWNTKLYDRFRTGIQLTSEGEKAYELVSKILEDIDALNQYFHVTSITESKLPVSITSCAVMEAITIAAVNILYNDFQETPIQIDKKGNLEIQKMLEELDQTEYRPDFIIHNATSDKMDLLQKKTSAYYNCFFLYEDELCVQVPKTDELVKYDRIPMSVLENLPMLLFTGVPSQPTESERILEKMGHKLKKVSRTATLETSCQLALNQHKYIFVGYPSVELRPMANVVYIPLEKPITTNMVLLAKKNCSNKAFSRAFMETIDNYYVFTKLW